MSNQKYKWVKLAVLCTSFFMAVTDSTSVYSALPSISNSLKFNWLGPEWVAIGFMLVFAGLVLVGGRISDYFGRKRMFTIGVLCFTFSSILCGFSWTGEVLILGRLIQGLAAAIMTPAALSLLVNTFTIEKERNKALGIWGAMGGIGATGGLLIGGPTTELLGWEWIFFINVPMGVLVLIFIPLLLKESIDRTISDFDFSGAALVIILLFSLAFMITGIPENGLFSIRTSTILLISFVFFIAFIQVERNAEFQLVPFRIFSSATLVGGNLLILISGMSVDGMLYVFTLFSQQLLGFTAIHFGMTMTAMTVFSVIGGYSAQYLVSRIGLRQVGIAGMVLLSIGTLLFYGLFWSESWLLLTIVSLSVFGLGMGGSFVTSQIAALKEVKEEDSGLASGIVETSFSIGGAFGIAIIASVSRVMSAADQMEVLTHSGVKFSFLAVFIFGCLGFGIAGYFFRKDLVERSKKLDIPSNRKAKSF